LFGDSRFAGAPQVAKILDAGLVDGFDPRGFPHRIVVGERRIESNGASWIADLCDDGTLYCQCDRNEPPDRRLPMAQLSAGYHRRAAYFRCSRPSCPAHLKKFWVPFRGPDNVLMSGPRLRSREPGPMRFLPSASKRRAAANHKARNSIEHYHSQMVALFNLNLKDRRSGRRVSGTAAVRMLHTIGDLLWNLTILTNLRRPEGPERPVLDWDQAFAGAVRTESSPRTWCKSGARISSVMLVAAQAATSSATS